MKYTLPIKSRGYLISQSSGHGKACTGRSKTISVWVSKIIGGGFGVVRMKGFRYNRGDEESREKAVVKAALYVASLPENHPMPPLVARKLFQK